MNGINRRPDRVDQVLRITLAIAFTLVGAVAGIYWGTTPIEVLVGAFSGAFFSALVLIATKS